MAVAGFFFGNAFRRRMATVTDRRYNFGSTPRRLVAGDLLLRVELENQLATQTVHLTDREDHAAFDRVFQFAKFENRFAKSPEVLAQFFHSQRCGARGLQRHCGCRTGRSRTGTLDNHRLPRPPAHDEIDTQSFARRDFPGE